MPDLATLETVDYLILGHVTEDITPAGPRLGGTAAFAALTARSLGLRVGVVTALNDKTTFDALDGIPIVGAPSEHTTTYENRERDGKRVQLLHRQAAPISYELVPDAWRRAPIVHLAPVAQELMLELPRGFSGSLLGVTPQGWMRNWDESGRVRPAPWSAAESFLSQVGAIVFSREDVGGDEDLIESMAHQTRVLAVTEGASGCVLYWNGDRRHFPAPRVTEVDATGAGDVFSAAFFIRLYQTRDPWEAARFSTRLASRSVTRSGLDGIPTQREIEECLMEVF